jgi:hypothetical protein
MNKNEKDDKNKKSKKDEEELDSIWSIFGIKSNSAASSNVNQQITCMVFSQFIFLALFLNNNFFTLI